MTQPDGTAAPAASPQDRVRAAMRVITGAMSVLLVLAIFPYTPSPAEDIKYLILAAFTLALAVLWALERDASRRLSRLLVVLVAFLGLNALAALCSDHVGNSLEHVRRLGLWVMLCVAVAHAFRTPRQAWRLLALVCVAVTMSSLYGFCQKAGLDPFPWAGRGTLEYQSLPATYGNPNLAAHVLIVAIIMGIGLSLRRETRWCALLVPLMAGHFWLTGIRSGKVALAAAATLAAVVLLVRRRGCRPIRGTVTTCLLVVVLVVSAALVGVGVTKWRTGRLLPVDSSLVLRYNSNYGAARMALSRPLLGYGPGNYAVENPPYWTPYEQTWFAVQRLHNEYVHNDYAEFVVDAGFGALALYCAVMAYLIARSVACSFAAGSSDQRNLALVLGACAMAFAVEGVFAFNARVPVSGTILFILAGAIEGVLPFGPMAGRRGGGASRIAGRWAVVLLVMLGAVAEGRSFAAAFFHQRANGATYWGDHEAAAALLTRAEKLEPWDWRISRALGAAEWRQGRREEAMAGLTRSLAEHPANVLTCVDLAKTWCDRAADEVAASGAADALAGSAATSLERAEGLAQDALNICPVLPEANEVLALVWAFRARGLEAAADTGRALEAWQTVHRHSHGALRYVRDRALRARLLVGAAEALDALEETSQVEALYQAAARANPEDMSLWRQYTEFAAKRGRWEGLAESMEGALSRIGRADLWGTTRAATLTQQLAHVYVDRLNEPGSAVAVLARGIAEAPDRLGLWAALASLPESKARDAALRDAVDASMAHWASRDVAPPVAVEAVASSCRGDSDSATEAAARLRELCASRAATDPPDVLAREYGWAPTLVLEAIRAGGLSPGGYGRRLLGDLAVVSAMSGRWEDADRILQFAHGNLPEEDQDSLMLLRAQVLSELGRHTEARDLILDALARKPDDVATRWAYARILAAGGQRDEAKDAYRRLAESADVNGEALRRIEQEIAELIDEADSRERPSDES